MIEAFEMGGDFHSRTALGMYDHIKEAIAKGKRPRHPAQGTGAPRGARRRGRAASPGRSWM